MAEIFKILTPVSYWILILLWGWIFVFFIGKLHSPKGQSRLMVVLLVILSVDAFRTFFESIYFGVWYTSLAGLLPPGIHNLLTQPQYIFIPKLTNLVAALLVFLILIRQWLPRENADRHERLAQITALEQEIQQRKAVEELLAQKNQFFINFVKDIPIALSMYDQKGVLIQANDFFKELWEIQDISEVIGKYSVFNDKQAVTTGIAERFQKAISEKENQVFEGVFSPSESGVPGRPRIVQTAIYPVLEDNQVVRIACSFIDLTEQKKMQAKQEVEARTQGALQMAGAACHELNQPLQVISAQLEMLRARAEGSEADRRFKTMQDEVKRMAEMIRKMDELTTVETLDYLGDTQIVDIKRSAGAKDKP